MSSDFHETSHKYSLEDIFNVCKNICISFYGRNSSKIAEGAEVSAVTKLGLFTVLYYHQNACQTYLNCHSVL